MLAQKSLQSGFSFWAQSLLAEDEVEKLRLRLDETKTFVESLKVYNSGQPGSAQARVPEADQWLHRETSAAGQSWAGLHPLDFSIILAVRVPQSNQLFRLRRHNGKSHEHTNHIEAATFYDFHIHIATERYQEIGAREDAYAEPTDRYGDFHGALYCLIDDSSLDAPPEAQRSLFEGV